jgi:transposase-like protein
MRRSAFEKLLDQLKALTRGQLAVVARAALSIGAAEQAAATIEAARAPLLACPRCQCRALHRNGHANGLQRFRCRACRRTFNSLTGTPLARLRCKASWLGYCTSMLEPSATVRRSAREVGVHRNTSFRWRHRFLAWIQHDRQLPLGGIVEADEMYVLDSEKGARALSRPARRRGGVAGKRGISGEQVCVLVARDRTGRTFDAVTGKGPLTAGHLRRHLAPVLAADALLVTDAHASYGAFASAAGVSHEVVNVSAGERVRGAVHVQNVNAYHSRMRTWLRHFCGVATRYLAHYCGWRWAIDNERIGTPEGLLRSAVVLIHT